MTSELCLLQKTVLEVTQEATQNKGKTRPRYISAVSRHETESGRVLSDEVVTEIALPASPAGHQLLDAPECRDSHRDSQSRPLGGQRHQWSVTALKLQRPMASQEEETALPPPSLKKRSPDRTKAARETRTVSWKEALKEEKCSSKPPFLPFLWKKNWKEKKAQKERQLKTGRMKEGEEVPLLPWPSRNLKREVSLPTSPLQREENRPISLPVKYQEGYKIKLTDLLRNTKARDRAKQRWNEMTKKRFFGPNSAP